MKAGPAPRPQGVRERGVALIIVLSFIVLCTILVVAFFASVTTEGAGQRAAASENSAMTLAASAAQLVEGTITMATEPTTDTTFAWASQPGMIRTYGTGSAASSDPLAYYKLYSSNNMIISGKLACNAFTGIGTTSLTSEVPRYWDYAPPVFTDLNAPLLKTTTTGTTSTTTPIFPIVDPRAADLLVEGFSSSATSVTLDGTVATTANPTAATSAAAFAADSGARLPMPVRWLYVLADGTFTAPDQPAVPTATMNTIAKWGATVASANVPSSTNPIVGRVAFWTDDESAKVNVNTASEGTYWDTPVADSGMITDSFSFPQTTGIGDATLASVQGAQHEYQRYPGHPATTCLSSVFGSALTGLTRPQVVQSIADAIPRISEVATASSASASTSLGGSQTPSVSSPTSTQSVATDRDRLYASLDEFQFTSTRAVQNVGVATTPSGASRTTEQSIVDTCRFFLTAHSKAPELNLFGLPRVAMWPIWDDSKASYRSPFDQEILHCSTIAQGGSNQHEMIFVRNSPKDGTTDWSIKQTVGYGTTPQPRNQQVYAYLQTLMGRAVPGFGGNFASSTKFGTDRDQVLTEIFDYIRCTNLADRSANDNNSSTTTIPNSYTYPTLGQVVPIKINATQGFGRILTVAEFALVLVKVDDRKDTSIVEYPPPPAAPLSNLAGKINVTPGADMGNNALPASIDPTTQTLVEWTLIPKFFSPMAGYPGLANDLRLHFKNITVTIGGKQLTYAENTVPDLFDVGRLPSSGRESAIGGPTAVEAFVEGGAPSQSMYPTGLCVVSGISGASPSGSATMQVSLSLSAQLYSPAGTSMTDPARGPLLQEFDNVTMPSTTVPIPSWTGAGFTPNPAITWLGTFGQSTYTPGSTATFNYVAATLAGSYSSKSTQTRLHNDWQTFITGNDTIRSMVPTGTLNSQQLQGDMRAVALTPTVGASTAYKMALTASGTAPSSTDTQADSLRLSDVISLGGKHGLLFKPLSGANSPELPVLPSNGPPQIAATIPADWDNGMGLLPDGPYVNKPDEGAYPSGDKVQYIGDYQVLSNATLTGTNIFSPNRLVSSPVMFGSLPVGADHPWRTLLFRPKALPGYQSLQSTTTTYQHPGGTDRTIPDHLLLDLFWMPVVEPYGISEPFVTSGKINLNTQIAPFTYITRTTGLQAVLKSVMMAALNPTVYDVNNNGPFIGKYKNPYYYGITHQFQNNPGVTTRYPINADKTIGQLTTSTPDTNPTPFSNDYPEFARTSYTAAAPNFFVSASQICDVPLIPTTATVTGPADLPTFWTNNSLTGDNCLERPYSMIYPRVTTKSNIFTVYVRAQALKKITSDPNQAQWQEGKDQVLSDYRGSFTIEKYFDPNTCDITDASGNPVIASTDSSMPTAAAMRGTKWRLLNVKRFGQ